MILIFNVTEFLTAVRVVAGEDVGASNISHYGPRGHRDLFVDRRIQEALTWDHSAITRDHSPVTRVERPIYIGRIWTFH